MSSIITSQQKTEIESMVARYEAAVAAGKTIRDERVHTMYRGAKHVLGIANADSPNTAFHSLTAKQVVEAFAPMVALQDDCATDRMDPCQ